MNDFLKYCRELDFAGQELDPEWFWMCLLALPPTEQLLCMQRILYNFTYQQYGKFSRRRNRCALLLMYARPSAVDIDPHGSYFVQYISDVACALDWLQQDADWRIKLERDSQPAMELNCISPTARSVVLGQVASLRCRDHARRHLTNIDTNIVEAFYLDQGACTYYSSAEVIAASADLPSLSHDIVTAPRASSLTILVSLDMKFATAFLPLLVHYARHLPSFSFHFIFIGENKAEFAAILAALADAQARCAGGVALRNISWSSLDLPRWVASPKTFYACARFLVADELLSLGRKIYIMDADVHLRSDPTRYFRSLAGSRIALPVTPTLAFLAPWRRYLAGNVYLEDSKEARLVIRSIKNYILLGLKEKSSWMLDQNAICYAVDSLKVDFTDLNGFDRPIRQEPIKKLFEKNTALPT